jgi:hypothetical protein
MHGSVGSNSRSVHHRLVLPLFLQGPQQRHKLDASMLGCEAAELEFSNKSEKAVRFGCGFIAGLAVGGIGAAYAFYDGGFPIIAISIGVALVFAFAALRFGDSFWRWLSRFSIWWV